MKQDCKRLSMERIDIDREVDTISMFSNVLLVEDNLAHASLITRAVKDCVGDVLHVQTGAEVIPTLEQSLVELVLCDLNLPDIKGLELISKIREIRPALPIVVLTSSNNLNNAVQAMREGAWDYMVKHLDSDLKEQIRIVINRIAQRKLLEIRELRIRQERDAFFAAAFAARDGLAILAEEGTVLFSNAAFKNFCMQLVQDKELADNVNLVSLINGKNEAIAQSLAKELHKSTESLWTSELEVKVKPKDLENKEVSYYYELSLNSVYPTKMSENFEEEELLPCVRYNVLWIRDTTRRKEQEKFQRDLLSTTTHDLKGPLGAILTSAEMLSEGHIKDEKTKLDLLTRIGSCARNSISIIDELLSARRIQDGVLVVKPRWHEVKELLEDVVLDYFPVAKSKDINFSSRNVDDTLQVYADKLGLSRVLGNLVNNALKFTPKGGKVEISAEKVGTIVQISVKDNGPGIDTQVQHKLFERFGRLEKDSEIEGSGIGLFVSKNIVQAHNGHIEVKSSLGHGTTFVVTLPDKVS